MKIKIEGIEIKFKKWWHCAGLIILILIAIIYPNEIIEILKELI